MNILISANNIFNGWTSPIAAYFVSLSHMPIILQVDLSPRMGWRKTKVHKIQVLEGAYAPESTRQSNYFE